MHHRSGYRNNQIKTSNQCSSVVVICCPSRILVLVNLWMFLIALVLERHEVRVELQQAGPVLQSGEALLLTRLRDAA
jgi:hypothetical protein